MKAPRENRSRKKEVNLESGFARRSPKCANKLDPETQELKLLSSAGDPKKNEWILKQMLKDGNYILHQPCTRALLKVSNDRLAGVRKTSRKPSLVQMEKQ
jgi:hypothetical protein